MNLKKIIAAVAAAAVAVTSMAIGVFADNMTKNDIGAQVFVMGNGSWNWNAVKVVAVDGVLSADVDATALIAGSKKDNDAAIGQFGIQFTTPIGKDKAQFEDGETAKTFVEGTTYSISYSLKKADGTVINEGTLTNADITSNGVYGEAKNIEILGNGTDWSELEAYGVMKFEATVSWNEPAADVAEGVDEDTAVSVEEDTDDADDAVVADDAADDTASDDAADTTADDAADDTASDDAADTTADAPAADADSSAAATGNASAAAVAAVMVVAGVAAIAAKKRK